MLLESFYLSIFSKYFLYQVLEYVRAGGRLERPVGSPDRLDVIMSSCWSSSPEDRPSFKMCVQEIECLLEGGESVSFISRGYSKYDGEYHKRTFGSWLPQHIVRKNNEIFSVVLYFS